MTEEIQEREKGMKVIRLTEFKRGEKIFESNGISRVKVTRDGVSTVVEIPIQSTGVTELIDSFSRKEPKPPVKKERVLPDTDMGKELGIGKPTWMNIPDFGDRQYIEEKAEYDSNLGLAIVMRGMAVVFRDEKGDVVEDQDEKLELLKEMGMTANQFSQVAEDIMNLTKWRQEGEENFLV